MILKTPDRQFHGGYFCIKGFCMNKNDKQKNNQPHVKISKENVAFIVSLSTLCFSYSIWSYQSRWCHILLSVISIISAILVFYSIYRQMNKK